MASQKYIGDETVVSIDSREKLRQELQGRESGGVYLTTKKIGETQGISMERVRYLVDEAGRKLRSPALYGYIKYGKIGREERRARLEEERRKNELDVMKKPIEDDM